MKGVILTIATLASIGIGWQVTKLTASIPGFGLGTAEPLGALVAFGLMFTAAVTFRQD